MGKMETRKSFADVRDEGKVAKKNRAERAEKVAAFDAKVQADAVIRREKLAAEGAAQAKA